MRTLVSRTLLAAMLAMLPGGGTGRFVCNLGMAATGPACPLCHVHGSAEQRGGGIQNSCCKFVAGQPAPDSRLARADVEGPLLAQAVLPVDTAVPTVADRHAFGGRRAAARTPSSTHLSNFLRL